MGKSGLIIILVLNLAAVASSAYYFLVKTGCSWLIWIEKDVTVVPLLLMGLAMLARSMFLLNLSLPFLVFYGLFCRLDPHQAEALITIKLSLLLVMVNIIYIVVIDIKLRSFVPSFWGLFGGILLLLAYHRVQFGETIRLDLPVFKIYKGLVDLAEKAVSSQNVT